MIASAGNVSLVPDGVGGVFAIGQVTGRIWHGRWWQGEGTALVFRWELLPELPSMRSMPEPV